MTSTANSQTLYKKNWPALLAQHQTREGACVCLWCFSYIISCLGSVGGITIIFHFIAPPPATAFDFFFFFVCVLRSFHLVFLFHVIVLYNLIRL